MARPAIERKLVDPVTLVESQPHYLAVTVVGGRDPCPQRFGIFRQTTDTVVLPDLGRVRERQHDRAEASRPPLPPVTRTVDGSNSYAEAKIEAAIEELKGAAARHPAYMHAAATCHALCERYGLDWPPVRDRLVGDACRPA